MINGQGRLKRAEQAAGMDIPKVKVTLEDGRTEKMDFMDAVCYSCGMISLARVLDEPDATDSKIVAVEILDASDLPYIWQLLQAADLDTYTFKGKTFKEEQRGARWE